MKTFLLASGLAAALAVAPAGAGAQDYPVKPIHLVVPFPPGGGVDTVARTLLPKIAWKQPIVIDNRPGAGGNIAADVVAKAPPDGYTLLITIHGFAISPSLYRKLPYDPLRDFAPVTQLTSTYTVLVVNPRIGVASLKDLIAFAKSKPGAINYGSTGVGGALHLSMELLKSMAGIDMLHVPYKGDGLLGTALLTGEVDVAFLPLSAVMPHVRQGRLRILAMSSSVRSATIPEVPTLAEAGLPGFEVVGWLGIFAPAATSGPIVDEIRRQFARAINLPEVKERLPAWGYEAVGSTPQQFAGKFRSDLLTYAKIIKEARIPLQD